MRKTPSHILGAYEIRGPCGPSSNTLQQPIHQREKNVGRRKETRFPPPFGDRGRQSPGTRLQGGEKIPGCKTGERPERKESPHVQKGNICGGAIPGGRPMSLCLDTGLCPITWQNLKTPNCVVGKRKEEFGYNTPPSTAN